MSKKSCVLLLALCCAVAGFIMANNILGVRLRTVSVRAGDAFYAEPSVTAASMSANFQPGDELLVLDKLEMQQPTAVKMAKDLLLEGEDRVRYKLAEGAFYRLSAANLEKSGASCVVEVRTEAGETARLEIPKEAALPVDEGVWLKVRKQGTTTEAWLRKQTQWF